MGAGGGGLLSPEVTLMQQTFGLFVNSFFLAALLSTKCMCSHLIQILTSKISCRVPQAVSADSEGQVQLECIHFHIEEKSAFPSFTTPHFAYIPMH